MAHPSHQQVISQQQNLSAALHSLATICERPGMKAGLKRRRAPQAASFPEAALDAQWMV